MEVAEAAHRQDLRVDHKLRWWWSRERARATSGPMGIGHVRGRERRAARWALVT